jgi:hypothetical protein
MMTDPSDLFEDVPDAQDVDGESMYSRYRCKACGGESFTVWRGDYRTAIACVACKQPASVHEG